jgi:hypothetical protein
MIKKSTTYVPIEPKIDSDPEFTMWSVVLVREVRKEKGPVRGPKPVATYIAIEYVCVLSCLVWLLAPFVK